MASEFPDGFLGLAGDVHRMDGPGVANIGEGVAVEHHTPQAIAAMDRRAGQLRATMEQHAAKAGVPPKMANWSGEVNCTGFGVQRHAGERAGNDCGGDCLRQAVSRTGASIRIDCPGGSAKRSANAPMAVQNPVAHRRPLAA